MKSARMDLLLGCAATLGLGIPFLLIAMAQQAMSTPVMAAARVVLAAVVLTAVVASSGRGVARGLLGVARSHPVALVVVAVTAAVAPNLLIGAAERHVPTSTTAVILATTPIWIAVGATLARIGDPIHPRHWVALPVAIVGVTLATGAAAPIDSWVWCLLPVAASASYAVSNLTVRRHLTDVHPLPLTAGEMIIGALVLTPFALAHPGELNWSPVAWTAVAVAGIGCSGLGWMANTALVQRVGALRASVVSYTAVVVSVLLGVAVLREPLTPYVVTGTVMLIAGIALFMTGTRPKTTDRNGVVLQLCILGFLAEAPMHAYELRRRIWALTGHVRTVSDGALIPALRRLESRALVEKIAQPGAGGPPRLVYELTNDGHDELRRRLAEPEQLEITDRNNFFTILAFLHQLPDPVQQSTVLARRLAFLDQPSRGFFVREERPVSGPAATFRDGMYTMARATWKAERAWLQRTLASLDGQTA